MDLILDTETTGFIHSKSLLDDAIQPHLMELACLVVKKDELIEQWDSLIHCPIDPTPGAFKVHGITREFCNANGHALDSTINRFEVTLLMVERIVCHNTDFDIKILHIAYLRAGVNPTRLLEMDRVCTMRSTRGLSLTKAFKKYVDPEGFTQRHRALSDAAATWGVYQAVVERGMELKS